MSDTYIQLLEDLADRLSLPKATIAHTQELVLDDLKIGFDFQPLDPNVSQVGDLLVFSVLGRPIPESEGEVHRLLLEGNNFWVGTGGATLGLQQEGGAVVLALRLQLEGLELEQLLEVLDNFVDTAQFWIAVIARTRESSNIAANSAATGVQQFA